MVVFDPPRFSVRLKDVLFDFDLADRRVADGRDPMSIAAKPLDWGSVKAKKAAFSGEAKTFLDDTLGVSAEANA